MVLRVDIWVLYAHTHMCTCASVYMYNSLARTSLHSHKGRFY